MHHWTVIEDTYLYDGTFEGLLSVASKCFSEKRMPNDIQIEANYIGNLIDKTIFIETNYKDSSTLFDAIHKRVSSLTLYYVCTAYLSGDTNKSKSIVYFLVYAFKHGNKINYMKSLDCVIEIQRLCKNVKGESHLLTGFLRFQALANQILYAEYESVNNVLEFLAIHFQKRLMSEIWMIHDKTRGKIALYNRETFLIVDADNLDLSAIENDKEDSYLLLWKSYFKNISIKERENRRCQMNFMPKKYWKYLPEVNQEEDEVCKRESYQGKMQEKH